MAATLVLMAGPGTLIPLNAQSTPVEIGYRDYNYGDDVVASITGEKPESKLWWNDGFWWASMWDTSKAEYHIFRFNIQTQSWIDTGTPIDDRDDTKADALWDGTKLYIASHVFSESAGNASESNGARLYRYSYNVEGKTYSLDSGFPVIINTAKSETLVLDKDTRGKLWITWVQSKDVMINCSVDGDQFWGDPFTLPVLGDDTSNDDISSLIAFDGKIGVFWSNQDEEEAYFAVHNDGAADNVWQPRETAIGAMSNIADDHLDLSTACDQSGNIYAALKTSRDNSGEPGLLVLKRDSQGVWTNHVAGLVDDDLTRAKVMVDADNQVLYIVAKGKEDGRDTINMKSASLTDLVFPEGPGIKIIESSDDDDINNPTSTKQCLGNETGLLVLASDKTTKNYFHNYIFPLSEVNNLAPVITAIPDQEMLVEESLSVAVQAFDPDENQVFISIIGLPEFAEYIDGEIAGIQSGIGSIEFSPTINDGGEYLIRVIATDNGEPALSRSETFLLTVVGSNNPPVLSEVADTAMSEGDTLTMSFSATDPDQDNVSLRIEELPEFMSFTINSDGTNLFTATPGFNDADEYSISVIADDDGSPAKSDTMTFVLTVNNVNRPPVITAIADQTVTEKDTLNFSITVTDPDGDILTLSASNLPEFGGFSDNGRGNGSFLFLPQSGDAGDYENIILTATDNGVLNAVSAVVQDTFSVMVLSGNDPPVVSDIPNQSVAEGTPFTVIALDNYVADPDHPDSVITWSYTGNSELIISIDENRMATILPPSGEWSGTEAVTFTATDPVGASDEDVAGFTITAVNDTPQVSGILDQQVAEGGAFTAILLDNFGSDADNDDSELTWSSSGNTDLTVTIDETRTATISIPDENWFGSETIVFAATDPGSLTGSDTVQFTVTPINDAPVAGTIPNQAIAEGQSFTAINLDGAVTDVDDPDSLMNWRAEGNAELIVTIDANRQAQISPPNPDWNGAETIMFIVSDTSGLSDSTSAVFSIGSENDPPVVSGIPDQQVSEGESFLTIALDDYAADVDNADSEISWQTTNAVDLTVAIDANRTATIAAPDANWHGSEIIVFTATDPGGLSDSDTAAFSISNVNDAPVISDISSQTIAEGDTFTAIMLDNFVSDLDNTVDQLSWQVLNAADLSVIIDVNRIATMTPPDSNWHGSELLTFIVSDPGGLSDSIAVNFVVTAINDRPEIANIPDQNIAEGAAFLPISLDDFVTDIDDPDPQISWSVSGNSELAVSIDETRQAMIQTPSPNWNGVEALVFSAADTSGLTVSDTAVFTVSAINDPPVIGSIPDQTIDEGMAFMPIVLDQFIDDIDTPDSLFNWTVSGNLMLTVAISDQRTATVLPPHGNWNGSENIIFTATDSAGISVSDTAAFTVSGINDPPQIADSLLHVAFNEDDSLLFPYSELYGYVEDYELPDSALLYQLIEGEFVTLVQGKDFIGLAAPENWFGADSLQLFVSDGEFADSAIIHVTVLPVNDPPQILNLPDSLTIMNDAALSLKMHEFGTDVDSPDSLLSWSFQTSGNLVLVNYNPETTQLTLTGRNIPAEVTLTATLSDETSDVSADIHISVNPLTGIEDNTANELPAEYALFQNYPNPFNPSTQIKFGLPKAGNVKIEVFNILGKKVSTLYDGYKPAGYHTLDFDGKNIASGVYFYRIEAGPYSALMKMILLK